MARKIILILSAVFLCFSSLAVFPLGEEIGSIGSAFLAKGFSNSEKLVDSNRSTFTYAGENASVDLTMEGGISHLYIEFERIPSIWTVEDTENGLIFECGKNAFLHEYIDIKELFGFVPKKLVLKFKEGTAIADIYVFSEGPLPDFVQIWEPPHEQADLLLVSTHSDDEHLFFAGIIPYYAVERDLKVQVAYGVHHFETAKGKSNARPHEQLDGLYAVGLRNYPIISDIPDVYSESKDPAVAYEQAIKNYKKVSVTFDDFKSYAIGLIRRFKPQVVVTHDLGGEYGHGSHVLVAKAFSEVIDYCNDPEAYKESAEKFGVWKPKKLYFHLYSENPIKLDWDTPYESLGGKTPFEVSKAGFSCHKSQHWTWFNKWLNGKGDQKITKARQIEKYSPCYYGLFYSSVGEDENKNDFFENVFSSVEKEQTANYTVAEIPKKDDGRHVQKAVAAIALTVLAAIAVLKF